MKPASGGASEAKHRARRLRIIGAVILAFGIFAADGVYWLGARSPAGDSPLPVIGEDKNATRQSETLFGKQAVFASQMQRTLKNPLAQAGLVVTAAMILAGGFFYAAGAVDRVKQLDSEEA